MEPELFDAEFFKIAFWFISIGYACHWIGSKLAEKKLNKEIQRLTDLVNLREFEHRAELKRLDLQLREETEYECKFLDEVGNPKFPEHEKQPTQDLADDPNEPWQLLFDKINL